MSLDELVQSPKVVIANVAEAFLEFLHRDPDRDSRARRFRVEHYLGDRCLLWAGSAKLVVTPLLVPSCEYVNKILGLHDTEIAFPSRLSESLCTDIMEDSLLFNRLVDYAGAEKRLTLIPYASTPQFFELVKALEGKAGLRVALPESPGPSCRWLVRYLDSKAGFRSSVPGWLTDLPVRLPEGFTCLTTEEAGQAVYWFVEHERSCIVKANIGESGIGNLPVAPSEFMSAEEASNAIQIHPFIRGDALVVEELIVSRRSISPSFEGFVPAPAVGQPRMTYMSLQRFGADGEFSGVLLSAEENHEAWYSQLMSTGLGIASRIQRMGYVGHFDIDAIVDDSGNPLLLELNPRRTGGTHVHELAVSMFGPDYLSYVTLLSNDAIDTGSIATYEDLLAVLRPLLYPIAGEKRGVIPTVTSSLSEHRFGCIVVGSSTPDVDSLHRSMLTLLAGSLGE